MERVHRYEMIPTTLSEEFLVESYENLDRLDRDLITLEKTSPRPGKFWEAYSERSTPLKAPRAS